MFLCWVWGAVVNVDFGLCLVLSVALDFVYLQSPTDPLHLTRKRINIAQFHSHFIFSLSSSKQWELLMKIRRWSLNPYIACELTYSTWPTIVSTRYRKLKSLSIIWKLRDPLIKGYIRSIRYTLNWAMINFFQFFLNFKSNKN
jgi:hypothetical protein